MNTSAPVHIPESTLEAFKSFRAAHGPIESPLAERILSSFFDRAIGAAFEARRVGSNGFKNIGTYVLDEFARISPDVLAVLELAADWAADPLKAAEAQLRPALEAKAKAEAEELKRRQEAELRAEVQKRTDALMASLELPAAGQDSK